MQRTQVAHPKFYAYLATLLAFGMSMPAMADNLHLIDSHPSGYAIYRSGSPTRADFKHWCRIGIQEVYVISGNADRIEDRYASLCPSMKIIANEAQDVEVLPDARALELFDAWVADAMTNHKKILFRCNCGCHRTGRLAAYYQMKYQNLTADDAIALMNAYGKMMMFHPELPKQVRDLEQRIQQDKMKSPAIHSLAK